ncbi:MAG: protein kinase [Planctomycetota bacterium]|nr:protein kinase [Planctomycetota bacterium]
MSDPVPPADDVPDRFVVDFTGATLLGIYEVREKLADGGMGAVYSGWDTNLGRAVVIKVPHVRFVSEAGFRARFSREIAELVRLEHPHIVRILAQGTHDDVPFFVLQFLGGGSLEDALERTEGGMSIDAAMAWFPVIADTLDFVHARGTVHRDVKPGNILFDDQGHVFLSDFGVAKALEDTDTRLTDLGTGVGSPGYMAPEQITGGELTPAADQYALASALYEALTGHPPFDEGSTIEVLLKKRSESPVPLVERIDGFPRAASNAVQRALAIDPAERFASCRAFADTVRDAARPKPEPVELPVPRARPSPWIALLLVLVIGLGAYALLDPGADGPPQGDTTTDGAAARITLLEAGAEPRQVLRYAIEPGPIGAVDVRMQQKIVVSVEGRPEPMTTSDIGQVWTLDMTVDEVSPAGEIALSWYTKTLQFAVTPGGTGLPTPDVIQQYSGVRGTVRLAANGVALDSETTGKDGAHPMVLRDMERLDWTMRHIVPVFPTEPVGIGARWEVSESNTMIDMRLTHTTTYEVVSIEDDVVRLDVSVAQTAAKQTFSPFSNDVEATLLSLHARGESQTEADLRDLIAREDVYDMSMDLEMEMPVPTPEGEDGPRTAKSTVEVTIRVETRRK